MNDFEWKAIEELRKYIQDNFVGWPKSSQLTREIQRAASETLCRLVEAGHLRTFDNIDVRRHESDPDVLVVTPLRSGKPISVIV